MKTKILRKENAITLVALIITIIVLLILAMVSIALVMNSGIITKSKTAVDKYSQEEIQEQIKLAYAEWQTAQWTSDAGDAATFMQGRLRTSLNDNGLTVTGDNGAFTIILTNEKTFYYNAMIGQTVDTAAELLGLPLIEEGSTAESNSIYKSGKKAAVIPAGYTISNEETEQNIDTGLVIKKDGNEWVWIPVSNDDLTAMYNKDETGWTMSGTGEGTEYEAVITKYKTTGTRSRGNPGDTSNYREPDILPNTQYGDGKSNNNIIAAGLGSNIKEMAINLRDDYKNMLDSLQKYGGFYVGRYELSNAGIQKNQTSLTGKNWYNLYAKCKTLGSDSTESRMIWGCQWDQVCKFIKTAKDANGDTISISDSRKYGNFYYSQAPANTGNYEQNVKQNTGTNETWKTYNIYDLAGNCNEWTQEAAYNMHRVYRGGSCDYYNFSYSVLGAYTIASTYSDKNLSSRPVLYLK